MSAVVMLNVYRLGTVDCHAGIFGRVGEEVGACTDADGTASLSYEFLDSLQIFLPEVLILTCSPSAWNHNDIEGVENASCNV